MSTVLKGPRRQSLSSSPATKNVSLFIFLLPRDIGKRVNMGRVVRFRVKPDVARFLHSEHVSGESGETLFLPEWSGRHSFLTH